jgi:hypothetical protein
MEAQIVNPSPKFEPPAFRPPPESGYLYLAASVAPPTGPPFVRRDARRDALLVHLVQSAAALEQMPAVVRASVYRGVLVPPAPRSAQHPARYDIAVLIETDSPESLDGVRASAAYKQLHDALSGAANDVHVMPARCLRYIGPVDRNTQGLFLFNHFTAADLQVATSVWEHLSGWYVAETKLDNSTLLAPIGTDDYVFVNHARWDKSPLRLAVEQFGRPSFRNYVLANLRANKVVAMPVLYRLANPR